MEKKQNDRRRPRQPVSDILNAAVVLGLTFAAATNVPEHSMRTMDAGRYETGEGARVQVNAPDASNGAGTVPMSSGNDVAKREPVARDPQQPREIESQPQAIAPESETKDALVAPIVRRRPTSVPLSFKVPPSETTTSKPKSEESAASGERSALGASPPASK